MNQAEHQLFLDKCEEAFLIFAGRNPQYEQTESNARRIATELRALGLAPTNAEHLQVVWDKLKPAPVEPEMDDVEKAARAAIASGEITVEKIEALSLNQLEFASRNEVFCAALAILEPRREPTPLTFGEINLAASEANLEANRGNIDVTVAERVRAAEEWKREHFAKLAAAAAPAPEAPRGVVNLHQAGHIPKLATEADLAAQIRRNKEDEKFQEEVALKMNRARRVKAYKASRGR